MTKIYVVTSGSYSSYRVHGVFTADKADYAARLYQGEAEEYAIDELPDHPEGMLMFRVAMKKNGDSDVSQKDPDDTGGRCSFSSGRLYVHTWAKDAEHAVKIANEIRGQKIAINEWPDYVEPVYAPGVSAFASTSMAWHKGPYVIPLDGSGPSSA